MTAKNAGTVRRTFFGAAVAAAIVMWAPLAEGHGPPAFVSGIVAENGNGPLVVSLSEGFAIRVDSEWRFVCPASFGHELSPPALSADGAHTYVSGEDDLFELDSSGTIHRLGRPELSRATVLSLATVGGGLFATRLAGDHTELWRVDDSSHAPLWQGMGVYTALTADSTGLWMVHQAGGSAVAVHVEPGGTQTDALTFELDEASSVSTVLFASDALYVNVVTPSLGSELLRVAARDGGTDGGADVVTRSDAPMSGPVSDGAGAAWITAGNTLFHVSRGALKLVFSQGERFVSVGSYEPTRYASLQVRLVELVDTGVGRDLFRLGSVHEPLLTGLNVDVRDACWVQWLVFRGDLARVDIFVDAGAPALRAGDDVERPAHAAAATGGCEFTRHAKALGPRGAMAYPLLLLLRRARRRAARRRLRS